jgi:hypothetical protein
MRHLFRAMSALVLGAAMAFETYLAARSWDVEHTVVIGAISVVATSVVLWLTLREK